MNSANRDEQLIEAEKIDRSLQVALAKLSGGLSPVSLILAFFDWYLHLLIHPAKQVELIKAYQEGGAYLFDQFIKHLLGDSTGEFTFVPDPQDKRFKNKSWQQFPYTFFYESFLMIENWWHVAATNVRGVNEHHTEVVDFTLRQIIDMLSPSNSLLTNPEIQQATLDENGKNLIRGLENALEDFKRHLENEPPVGSENYVVGKNLAISPGKVILKNKLIELIQYQPSTKKVYDKPILITPAWIMKYYILDLTPAHSLVKYLVDHGHTVFMISWKNPDRSDRNLQLKDYQQLGIMTAIDTINKVIPETKINLIGYCLGGTLSSIVAATMARNEDNRLASLTLLAAQTDFRDPGELGLFIDESQISFLESIMQKKGYLDTSQMAGAFQLLRSNDLIWSRLIHDYLLGVRKPLTDLMAWNADATRMPYKMHSEYLRKLFLRNELANGKFVVDDKPIALTDITLPIFVVATERDHVSPWRSVFKINLLTDSDVTFVLTSGGHNVGIVSLPTSTKRYYRISTLKESDRFIDANSWYEQTIPQDGSWWPALENWLANQSENEIKPPKMGNPKKGIKPMADAPGTYVFVK